MCVTYQVKFNLFSIFAVPICNVSNDWNAEQNPQAVDGPNQSHFPLVVGARQIKLQEKSRSYI